MLEATNKSKEEMLVIVENACLKIGGMEFKLQIHVVGDCHDCANPSTYPAPVFKPCS
ncbi:hypothetical protein ID866_11873 [Astraeus odoratus]|nr:hypothetical protein ID866_11873 [Astraeus odoratus]